ncbi:Uma2 family endonuclease [Streptomyces sp. NPDC048255]|uniref:Uma2 family endonuclease n=1 Tax=Streptomyces sp. NPDC048255 TaxID=3154713 RepID=UPI0033EC8BC8
MTSSNYDTDLRSKAGAHASAVIPVCVIVDRQHQRIRVLTDPQNGDYASHRVHAPGELAPSPTPSGPRSPWTSKSCWRRVGRRTATASRALHRRPRPETGLRPPARTFA